MRAHDRRAGVTMVEFAIVAPLLFLVVFGLVDFSRAIQANTTIAEAARQGARQAAANAAPSDNPFADTVSGSCSGTVFTQNASGAGCLTDQAITTTVEAVLRDLTTKVQLVPNAVTANCPNPPLGQAEICIAPAQSGSPDTTDADCAAATLRLGHPPGPGDLGSRKEEWQNPKFQTGRCFLVQVTVKYAFQPWTPIIGQILGNRIQLVASTATVAEY